MWNGFVSADAAAMFLGITRRTLLQKVREGKIPAHPLDPSAQRKEWRFKLSELDRVLVARLNSCDQPT
jgi:excisionase family DNA binding protein